MSAEGLQDDAGWPRANPTPDVLADVLLAAVDADRLGETVDLLSDLVGERPVREAVGIVFRRLSQAVEAAAGAVPAARTPEPPDDVFDLLQRLRATTPGGRP